MINQHDLINSISHLFDVHNLTGTVESIAQEYSIVFNVCLHAYMTLRDLTASICRPCSRATLHFYKPFAAYDVTQNTKYIKFWWISGVHHSWNRMLPR